MAWVSRKMGQFTYFSQQVGESIWRGKKVLDFGGNIGNLLKDPNSNIAPDDLVLDQLQDAGQARTVFCGGWSATGHAEAPPRRADDGAPRGGSSAPT